MSRERIELSLALAVISALLLLAPRAEPADRHLIEGVYWLICEGDAARAERELLLSVQLSPDDPEPYYFLGLIKYQRGKAAGSEEELAEALHYLLEAERRGIRHDRLHPDVLRELRRDHPDLKPKAPKAARAAPGRPDRVEVEFEAGEGEVILLEGEDGSKIRTLSGETVTLRCGRSYKVSLDREGTLDRAFKRITPILAILALWIFR